MMTKEGHGFNGFAISTTDHCVHRHGSFDSHSGSRQSARAMRSVCWFVVFVLALGACGSKAPENMGATGQGSQQWVCRPDGEAWDCDQGNETRPPAAPDQA